MTAAIVLPQVWVPLADIVQQLTTHTGLEWNEVWHRLRRLRHGRGRRKLRKRTLVCFRNTGNGTPRIHLLVRGERLVGKPLSVDSRVVRGYVREQSGHSSVGCSPAHARSRVARRIVSSVSRA